MAIRSKKKESMKENVLDSALEWQYVGSNLECDQIGLYSTMRVISCYLHRNWIKLFL
jgi:hypothetical protein